MTIQKSLFVIIFSIGTSLFSANLKDITLLVSKINNSKNKTIQEKLLYKLHLNMDTLNQRDYYEAQYIIDTELKSLK